MSNSAESVGEVCRECGAEKPLSCFLGAPREQGGRLRRCLACIRAEAARATQRREARIRAEADRAIHERLTSVSTISRLPRVKCAMSPRITAPAAQKTSQTMIAKPALAPDAPLLATPTAIE